MNVVEGSIKEIGKEEAKEMSTNGKGRNASGRAVRSDESVFLHE